MRLPALLALAFAFIAAESTAAPPADPGKARAFEHVLKPGDVAEECLRLETEKSRSFEWTSDGPVDFNIHYHQGDKVSYPVKLNKQRKGGGRFTARTGEDYCWMWSTNLPAKVTGSIGPEE